MQVSISRSYGEGPRPSVTVDIIGDNTREVLDALTAIDAALGRSNATANVLVNGEDPAKNELPAQPPGDEAAKTEDGAELQKALDEALQLITKHYGDKPLRPKFKELLATFGVSRFGEIPKDRGAELLASVKAIIG